MSVLQPPQLPDVPFARLAPGMGASPVPQFERPVSRATRLFLFLPLPATALIAGLYLLKAYRTGGRFVHDANYAFVWFFHTAVFGAAAVAVLLTASIVLVAAWRRLDGRDRRRAGQCGVAALVVAGLALWFSGSAFRWGKSRAYSSVNATRLVADCTSMAAALAAPGNSRAGDFVEGTAPSVPGYVRSLGPRYVSVKPTEVEVIMSHDFMSGAYHESFIVPVGTLNTDPKTYASQRRMTLISIRPPVFRAPAAE